MTAITNRRIGHPGQPGQPGHCVIVLITVVLLAASCAVAVDLPASTIGETTSGLDRPADGSDAAPTDPEPSDLDPDPSTDSRPAGRPDFEVSDRWPEVVREYVDFVQTTRGEEFLIIADVRFVDQAELRDEFRGDVITLDDLPAESQEVVARLDDMYRALGLTNEDFDILDADHAVAGEIGAFYDWEVGEIVFPAPDSQSPEDIPLVDRPVLVHELGHALQIHRRVAWAQNLDDQALSLALLEGEAEWLFDQYLWSLSDDQFLAWNDALPEWEPSGQPEILETEFAVSYVLGSRFFHARYAQDGIDGIDAVFKGVRHVTAQMLIDPWRFSGREVREELFDYEWPDPPGAAKPIDISYDFPMSAVTWHQVLGAVLGGPQALSAARGINSFTLPSGWLDGDDRLCFGIYVNASIGHEAVVEQAFSEWAAAPGVNRWFEPRSRGYEVGGCDPGPGNVPTPRATSSEVLGEAAAIIDSEVWSVEAGLSPAIGFCLGWEFLGVVEAEPGLNFYDWFAATDTAAATADC